MIATILSILSISCAASVPKGDGSNEVLRYGVGGSFEVIGNMIRWTQPTAKAFEIRSTGHEIMRITPQGKIYLRGRLIGEDRELGKVLTCAWGCR